MAVEPSPYASTLQLDQRHSSTGLGEGADLASALGGGRLETALSAAEPLPPVSRGADGAAVFTGPASKRPRLLADGQQQRQQQQLPDGSMCMAGQQAARPMSAQQGAAQQGMASCCCNGHAHGGQGYATGPAAVVTDQPGLHTSRTQGVGMEGGGGPSAPAPVPPTTATPSSQTPPQHLQPPPPQPASQTMGGQHGPQPAQPPPPPRSAADSYAERRREQKFNPIDHIFQFHQAFRLEIRALESDALRVEHEVLLQLRQALQQAQQRQLGGEQAAGDAGPGRPCQEAQPQGDAAAPAGGDAGPAGDTAAAAAAAAPAAGGAGDAEMTDAAQPNASAATGGPGRSKSPAAAAATATAATMLQQQQQQTPYSAAVAAAAAAGKTSGFVREGAVEKVSGSMGAATYAPHLPRHVAATLHALEGRFQFLWGIYRCVCARARACVCVCVCTHPACPFRAL